MFYIPPCRKKFRFDRFNGHRALSPEYEPLQAERKHPFRPKPLVSGQSTRYWRRQRILSTLSTHAWLWKAHFFVSRAFPTLSHTTDCPFHAPMARVAQKQRPLPQECQHRQESSRITRPFFGSIASHNEPYLPSTTHRDKKAGSAGPCGEKGDWKTKRDDPW